MLGPEAVVWRSMEPTPAPSQTTAIIKSDRKGRVRYSSDYKAEVLAAFANSGMSGPDFARQCGIKYPTFASWISKQRREGLRSEVEVADRQDFILAEVRGDSSRHVLKVELPGGAVAHLADSAQAGLLAALIKSFA